MLIGDRHDHSKLPPIGRSKNTRVCNSQQRKIEGILALLAMYAAHFQSFAGKTTDTSICNRQQEAKGKDKMLTIGNSKMNSVLGC